MKNSVLKSMALLLCLSLVVGCATKGSVRRVRASVDDTQAIAEEALATAREAKQLASEADSRSKRTEEVLNRGFKRSMYK